MAKWNSLCLACWVLDEDCDHPADYACICIYICVYSDTVMISVQAKWETNKTVVAFKSWRRVFVTVIQVSIIKWYIPQNFRTDGGKTMFKQGHHQQARYDHSTLWECRDLQTHSWDQRQIIGFEPRGSWENTSNTLCLSQIRFPDEKHISIYYIIKSYQIYFPKPSFRSFQGKFCHQFW